MIQVIPSILSADLTRLGEQVREAVAAGADRIQVDVMDGHFVPNLTFGPGIVAAVRAAAPHIPIEAHLMVERPEQFVHAFVEAGADYVLIQVESTYSLYRTVHAIAEAGLPHVSMVNVMTVEPGFGGQRFIATSPDKVRRVREIAPDLDIEVDGGIDQETAPVVVEAGARLLVAGSSVFGYAGGVAAGIRTLRDSVG